MLLRVPHAGCKPGSGRGFECPPGCPSAAGQPTSAPCLSPTHSLASLSLSPEAALSLPLTLQAGCLCGGPGGWREPVQCGGGGRRAGCALPSPPLLQPHTAPGRQWLPHPSAARPGQCLLCSACPSFLLSPFLLLLFLLHLCSPSPLPPLERCCCCCCCAAARASPLQAARGEH